MLAYILANILIPKYEHQCQHQRLHQCQLQRQYQRQHQRSIAAFNGSDQQQRSNQRSVLRYDADRLNALYIYRKSFSYDPFYDPDQLNTLYLTEPFNYNPYYQRRTTISQSQPRNYGWLYSGHLHSVRNYALTAGEKGAFKKFLSR